MNGILSLLFTLGALHLFSAYAKLGRANRRVAFLAAQFSGARHLLTAWFYLCLAVYLLWGRA